MREGEALRITSSEWEAKIKKLPKEAHQKVACLIWFVYTGRGNFGKTTQWFRSHLDEYNTNPVEVENDALQSILKKLDLPSTVSRRLMQPKMWDARSNKFIHR